MTDSEQSSSHPDVPESSDGGGESGGSRAEGDPAEPANEFGGGPTGEERVGELLAGRYRLAKFIGEGAMGEVFRAEHALMKKTVAVKILHSDISGRSTIVERFRREAQAAANIDHPNVCVATDFGRTDEKEFFLVMEFLEGPTLKEAVREQGAFEVERALYIANQIVSALVRAHEVGVVHRDLKPDNIMLVERGGDSDFVKILDFGIARVRMDDETPELTKTGAVFGTPSYMSPEQAAGDPVDHRTDLYAIGSLLFEMLTGRRVFEAERGAEVMAKHVSEAPPEPSEHSPAAEIESNLEDLILELLEKNPADRPQTAVELQRRLLALGELDRSRRIPGLREDVSVPGDEEAETGRRGGEAEPSGDRTPMVPRALDSLSAWLKRRGRGARRAIVGLGALSVAVALSLGGLVASGYVGNSSELRAREAANRALLVARQTLKERPPVRRAFRALDRGAIRTGIRRLERLDGDVFRDNPHLHFLIGQSYAELGEWEECIDHFERVLEIEPRYVEEREFLRHLLGAFGADRRIVIERVRSIVEPHLDRPSVRSMLARTAWKSSDSGARRRAYETLESTGALENVPEWVRRSIALRRAEGCEEHRRHIRDLAELGDDRALSILRSYQSYPDSIVGCVREDIDRAVRTLKSKRDAGG